MGLRKHVRRILAPVAAVALVSASVVAGPAVAAPVNLVNGGFESGNLSGWTASGAVAVVASFSNYWAGSVVTYVPAQGDRFAVLSTYGCGSSTLQQNFTAAAGDTISGSAAFSAGDYLPFNDVGLVKIAQGDVVLFYKNVAAVGDYGQSPWTPWSWTVPAAGTFTLFAQTFNVGDCGVDSYLLLDGPGVPSDTTPPVITPSVTGMLGANGWYTSDVNVSWTVADAESSITSAVGCGASVVTADTTGTTFTCTATSLGGTASGSVTVMRDATSPSVAIASPPNGATFTTGQSVAVSFSGGDATSGLANLVADLNGLPVVDGQVISLAALAGANTLTVKGADNAGNQTTAKATFTVTISAAVNCDPNTLKKSAEGEWITCYIELPAGYDAATIDGASVTLNGTVAAYMGKQGWAKPTANSSNTVDSDGDGVLERMVKFDRAQVAGILASGSAVTVTVAGQAGSLAFGGSDTIRVMD